MTTSEHPVRAATPDDLEPVVEVLTAAFLDDPLMSWAFEPMVRPRRLDAMWRFMAGEGYLPHGASTVVVDEIGSAAAALWLPPGVELDDAFWAERFTGFLEVMEGDVARLGEMSAVMSEHHPAEPHWYLLAIGVDPTRHGQGLGTALLTHTLSQARPSGPAYLEATSTRSRALYERAGFEVISSFAPPEGPPLWGMWREP